MSAVQPHESARDVKFRPCFVIILIKKRHRVLKGFIALNENVSCLSQSCLSIVRSGCFEKICYIPFILLSIKCFPKPTIWSVTRRVQNLTLSSSDSKSVTNYFWLRQGAQEVTMSQALNHSFI